MMQLVADPSEAHRLFAKLPRPFAFVPTMGALHDGHLALVRAARASGAAVGVSIFVNPLQFGTGEDFGRYPRDLARDRERLDAAGVELLFTPSEGAIYPPGFSTSVDAGAIGDVYEGAVRPGHFRGVATVVVKLLHIAAPDALYLGQKDAQQTAVLRRIVRDLNLPVEIRIVETVREPDGLALSSRNAYLSERERDAAPTLHRALVAMHDAMRDGTPKASAVERARAAIDPMAAPDYFDVVDATTFAPLEGLQAESFVIGAARFGATRLIDNLWVRS
jgi:pantoate--beta-alanine ligase